MSNPQAVPLVQEEEGKIKLVASTVKKPDGSSGACIRRVPELLRLSLAKHPSFSIENLEANGVDVEVVVPTAASALFSTHPLKAQSGQLRVKLNPGKSAVFQLSGKTGVFKFRTEPSRCSGAHHDDVHIEC